MKSPIVTPKCPGSAQQGYDGRFPGDSDRCPYCGSQVIVTESCLLRTHRISKRAYESGRKLNSVPGRTGMAAAR